MGDRIIEYLLYFGQLLLLTLGTVVICGLAVHLCSRLFSKLLGNGSGAVFDITSIIGTPVHELGHAVMCLLFGHRIRHMQLWSPTAKGGAYGYVEHSYNRKNPWARLGNLFIGLGPIFSGLGVVVLMLWLCFPTQWAQYLNTSLALSESGTTFSEIFNGIFSLFRSIPGAFRSDWLRCLLGLLVILPVSLHISLSWADIRGSLDAIPLYLLIVALFGLITYAVDVHTQITAGLWLLNLRLLSLFSVVIAFCAVWVVIALLARFVRIAKNWF